MAKDICILDIRDAQPGFISIRCLFWLTVTAGYKMTGFVSSYPDINTDTNTTALLASIQAGTVLEETQTFTFPTLWVTTQWTVIEQLLLAYLNARKAYRGGTLVAIPDPGIKYAILHDSATGWSA